MKRREKSELREGILDSSACERLPCSLYPNAQLGLHYCTVGCYVSSYSFCNPRSFQVLLSHFCGEEGHFLFGPKFSGLGKTTSISAPIDGNLWISNECWMINPTHHCTTAPLHGTIHFGFCWMKNLWCGSYWWWTSLTSAPRDGTLSTYIVWFCAMEIIGGLLLTKASGHFCILKLFLLEPSSKELGVCLRLEKL